MNDDANAMVARMAGTAVGSPPASPARPQSEILASLRLMARERRELEEAIRDMEQQRTSLNDRMSKAWHRLNEAQERASACAMELLRSENLQ